MPRTIFFKKHGYKVIRDFYADFGKMLSLFCIKTIIIQTVTANASANINVKIAM